MSSEDKKIITLEELKKHNTQDDLWLLINGEVYNVSSFMDEHPGGDEVLLSEAGKDATEAFEDVGHSDDARKLLPPLKVGEIEGGVPKAKVKTTATSTQAQAPNSNPLFMFIPLIAVVAWLAYKYGVKA
ncbi:hypothetical protein OC834_001392 [Tilletia horrida]|uniref:Cytochrome b5 heme-binding domain-containing protein n=1 Tax=Tilletia horrida TaxID=155126 RepID=A0AAN6JM86_9BASI|nr:hypothetical protein OC835_002906 [Tilletia horrida]KAK0535798.1 hypothetical protein OC834_001392 [Tilletia horrida]KAK0538952.1 hypothetical protein OC842_001149 [Tilletia horrida]KAK0564483.1 hypothetical protein OC844_001684 [Tilletia horrida]